GSIVFQSPKAKIRGVALSIAATLPRSIIDYDPSLTISIEADDLAIDPVDCVVPLYPCLKPSRDLLWKSAGIASSATLS
ncbi:hypothetical protein HAX54_038425, partial [Datura stramonium]|nr:hypothetical protein [Datura stramonium]